MKLIIPAFEKDFSIVSLVFDAINKLSNRLIAEKLISIVNANLLITP